MNEWRDIPGFNGMYQVSWDGRVRSWFAIGKRNCRGENPVVLKPFRRGGKTGGVRYCVNLSKGGRMVEVSVLSLVVDCWLGGRPHGMVAYHKNGDKTDNCVNNIAFATREELGSIAGRSNRRPVAKIDNQGNVVEFYQSAKEAAKANYMSNKTMCNKCNGESKNYGAFRFAWDV